MSNLYEFTETGQWEGKFVTRDCRRALSPSKSGFDFSLNPYGGCAHGCVYCYAQEYTHSEWDGWRVVKVRSNIANRLSKELRYAEGSVTMGTSTDPYQYAEARFQITRDCLTVLKKAGRKVCLITKSDLVTRDIDIMKDMDITVAVTITGIDERMSKITEPGAPMPSARLRAVRELLDAGIDTWVMGAPLLSHIEGREEEYVDAVADTGVKRMHIGGVHYRPELRARMERMHLRSASESSLMLVAKAAESRGISADLSL